MIHPNTRETGFRGNKTVALLRALFLTLVLGYNASYFYRSVFTWPYGTTESDIGRYTFLALLIAIWSVVPLVRFIRDFLYKDSVVTIGENGIKSELRKVPQFIAWHQIQEISRFRVPIFQFLLRGKTGFTVSCENEGISKKIDFSPMDIDFGSQDAYLLAKRLWSNPRP